MVSITELARSKEEDPTLAEDLLEGVKQHAEGEASHHELEAAQQEQIVRVVIRKYKLFSKNQVRKKFQRTPRSLNLPEIKLHDSSVEHHQDRTYYAVMLDKDKQPTLREERISSVGTKRQLIKDGVNLFKAQQGIIMQHVVGARVSNDEVPCLARCPSMSVVLKRAGVKYMEGLAKETRGEDGEDVEDDGASLDDGEGDLDDESQEEEVPSDEDADIGGEADHPEVVEAQSARGWPRFRTESRRRGAAVGPEEHDAKHDDSQQG